MIILTAMNTAPDTTFPPSGFSVYTQTESSVDGAEWCVFYKFLDGSEGSSVSGLSNDDAYDDWAVIAMLFSGINTTTPFQTEGHTIRTTSGSSPLTLSAPSVTPTTNGCYLVFWSGQDVTSSNQTAGVFTTPTGFTNVTTVTSARNVANAYAAYMKQTTAAATGTTSTTVTSGSAGGGMGQILVLQPA
jgi:hypothetical protein